MHVWKMSLRRRKSAIISWAGSIKDSYNLKLGVHYCCTVFCLYKIDLFPNLYIVQSVHSANSVFLLPAIVQVRCESFNTTHIFKFCHILKFILLTHLTGKLYVICCMAKLLYFCPLMHIKHIRLFILYYHLTLRSKHSVYHYILEWFSVWVQGILSSVKHWVYWHTSL